MNKLSIRLALIFGLVALVSVGVVALISNRSAGSEFRRYLEGNETASLTVLAPAFIDFYETDDTWDGIDLALDGSGFFTGSGRGGRGREGFGAGTGQGAALLLADSSGRIVYDSQDQQTGEVLTRADLAMALSLERGGNIVGYLLMRHGPGSQLSVVEQGFLDRVNEGLLIAAVIGLVLGGLLGMLLARNLARPMSDVAAAAEAIAGGDLSQRVPEGGTEEMVAVAQSFNRMAENLEEAERLRSNLVADVAHELRTPLTVIQGNLHAILDGVYPLEKQEIATVYDQSLLLNRLVDDLGELARAEAGQLQLEQRPTDVAAVLEQARLAFSPVAEARGIELRVEVPAGLPAVLADPDRLAQILHNLISNALRYVPSGGAITLGARLADSGRSTGLESHVDHVVIRVADTGRGIPPEEIDHVFDRFWTRGVFDNRIAADSPDTPTPDSPSGSGLGLAITKYLVEAHGGTIGVESQPGQGTRFWFTLSVTGGPVPAS
ncbi:MAG: HAMP domain-containing sensor histidine kinase [Chloroflexota bacterium]|nr:HAMP domain-containing sensor histidine kinase [Chloroflexota bacterium]